MSPVYTRPGVASSTSNHSARGPPGGPLFEDARAARPRCYTGPNPTKNRLVKVPRATTPGQAAAERVVPRADQVMALGPSQATRS